MKMKMKEERRHTSRKLREKRNQEYQWRRNNGNINERNESVSMKRRNSNEMAISDNQ
jgi:hypothetical protein